MIAGNILGHCIALELLEMFVSLLSSDQVQCHKIHATILANLQNVNMQFCQTALLSIHFQDRERTLPICSLLTVSNIANLEF